MQNKRDSYLKRKYGITEAQWQEMYTLQNGKCPICIKPLYLPGNSAGKRAAAVDHDHKTGRVRGLTCLRCNRFRISRNTAESVGRLYKYLSSTFDGRLL
jgi:hypothetical protein